MLRSLEQKGSESLHHLHAARTMDKNTDWLSGRLGDHDWARQTPPESHPPPQTLPTTLTLAPHLSASTHHLAAEDLHRAGSCAAAAVLLDYTHLNIWTWVNTVVAHRQAGEQPCRNGWGEAAVSTRWLTWRTQEADKRQQKPSFLILKLLHIFAYTQQCSHMYNFSVTFSSICYLPLNAITQNHLNIKLCRKEILKIWLLDLTNLPSVKKYVAFLQSINRSPWNMRHLYTVGKAHRPWSTVPLEGACVCHDVIYIPVYLLIPSSHFDTFHYTQIYENILLG